MAASRESSSKGLRLCFNKAMSSPVCVLFTRGLIYYIEGRIEILAEVGGREQRKVDGTWGEGAKVAEKVPYRKYHIRRNPEPASPVREF